MGEVPDQLWHYSSPGGALGVLRDRAIRATMIHYLNDSRELNFALDLAKEVIRSEASDSIAVAECEKFLDRIRSIAVYVASFSTEKDDLSQWRAYSPGEGGHALCFSASKLQDLARDEGYQLLPCLYERQQQEDLLRPVVKDMLAAQASGSGPDLYEGYALAVALRAAQVKDPAFRAEREWRLVAGPTQECDLLEYRENEVLVIPYRVVSLKNDRYLAIEEIMIGPHRHPRYCQKLWIGT